MRLTAKRPRFVVGSILGEVLVESPLPSRRATMEDMETTPLLCAEAEMPQQRPETPTVLRRRIIQLLPPMLSTLAPRDELNGADGRFEEPPTPSTPSAFTRAFGVLAKAFVRP